MKFEKAMTKHGAPLYLFPMPNIGAVTCGVLIKAGTRDEEWPKQAGMAHAFEHMVFQGNARKKTSKAVSEEIELIGGSSNAFTCQEAAFFHNIVPAEYFMTAMRSIASMLTTSLFREQNVRTEMDNIIEEIKMYNDHPQYFAEMKLNDIVFNNHPLVKATLGTEDALRAFTAESFRRWQEQFCNTNNYAFIVVGDASMEKAIAVVNSFYFGPSGKANPRCAQKLEPNTTKAIEIEKDIEQANIYLGAPIGPASDKNTRALDLYNLMIDGGSSFPLFQEVRDKRGLCYSVQARIEPWSDVGLFTVYAGVDKNKISKAVDRIKKVVWDNRANKTLFNKAKKMLVGNVKVTFSNPSHVFVSAAMEIIFSGAPKSPQEIIDEANAITLSDVTEAVEKYINPDNFYHSYVVPKGTTIAK